MRSLPTGPTAALRPGPARARPRCWTRARRWLQGLASLALLALVLPASAAGMAPETAAQRLHRMGVQCQEVYERRDCAIENFEKLIDEPTDERTLVTDAMLRLVKLYQSENRIEQAQEMLREFWDAGMKWRRRGHIPYSARYLPDEFDMLFMVHMQQVLDAPITRELGPDAREWVTTCDRARRDLLSERRRWERAEREAKRRGKATIDVIYDDYDRELARRRRAAQRRAAQTGGRRRELSTPVFAEALCPLAEALGHNDISAWTRMVGGMHHREFQNSAGVVEVPKLQTRIRHGVQKGALLPRQDGVYALAGLDYYGGEVHVVSLDHDELVVAPAGVMPQILNAGERNRRSMDRKLDKLLTEVPPDVGMFFVMTEEAMANLGLGSMSSTQRTFLKALLPRPKGFQMAAVFHDYFGMFMRMPTDTPIKGGMLVRMAQSALFNQEEEADEEELELLRQLDVSQAEDKRALLLSYVLSPTQVRKLFWY